MIYNKETNLWEIDSKIYLTDEEFQQYINTIFEDENKGVKEDENKSRSIRQKD